MAKSSKIRAALGFGLAATAILTVPAQVGAQQQEIVFLADADSSAGQWIRNNPRAIAVAIRLGRETPVSPTAIEQALRADFREHGINTTRFFYERGGDGGSSVVYRSRNHAWGPFGLAESRNKVADAAAQLRFEISRGLN